MPISCSGASIRRRSRAAACRSTSKLPSARLAERIGAPLKLATEHAALGVSEMVDENMANAARVHAIESGKDLAPAHADRVRRRRTAACRARGRESSASAACSSRPTRASARRSGCCARRSAYEIVRGRLIRLGSFDAAAGQPPARRDARGSGGDRAARRAGRRRCTEQRSAFMRYRGQGHEIAVALPVRDFTAADRSTIRDLFEAAYRRLYSRAIPGVEIEILSWVVSVSAPAEGRLGARRLPSRRASRNHAGAAADVRSGRPASSGTCRSTGAPILRPARASAARR